MAAEVRVARSTLTAAGASGEGCSGPASLQTKGGRQHFDGLDIKLNRLFSGTQGRGVTGGIERKGDLTQADSKQSKRIHLAPGGQMLNFSGS